MINLMNRNSMHKAPRLRKDMGIYGKQAYQYARWTRADMEEYAKLAQKIAGLVNEGDHILEVASGPGYTLIELARLGSYHLTAMDISSTFVEIGKANVKEAGLNIDFLEGNVSRIPFEENHFDFIVNRAAFKNFREPVTALKEMYRVLNSGGKILIQDLRPDAPAREINKYINRMKASFFQKLVQKIIFHLFLTRAAHSREEFEQFLSQAAITNYSIQEDHGIGYEIRINK